MHSGNIYPYLSWLPNSLLHNFYARSFLCYFVRTQLPMLSVLWMRPILLCPFLLPALCSDQEVAALAQCLAGLVGPRFHTAGIMCFFYSEYLEEFTPVYNFS